ALPERVQLRGRSEAVLGVPAPRAVRDDDAGVDASPRVAIDPAPRVELVREPEEQRDAPAGPRRAGPGGHARGLLALRPDDVGPAGGGAFGPSAATRGGGGARRGGRIGRTRIARGR